MKCATGLAYSDCYYYYCYYLTSSPSVSAWHCTLAGPRVTWYIHGATQYSFSGWKKPNDKTCSVLYCRFIHCTTHIRHMLLKQLFGVYLFKNMILNAHSAANVATLWKLFLCSVVILCQASQTVFTSAIHILILASSVGPPVHMRAA